MSQSIEALIFDLDGTLADTLADIAAAMDRVLRRAGLPTHPEDDYRRFVGRGARALVEQALGDGLAHRTDAFLARFIEDYTRNLVVESRPYPGIDDLLSRLASYQPAPKLAVLSNKPHDATLEVVARLFEARRFDAVYGHRADWPKKPHPEAAQALAVELGVVPSRCLFIGDTAVDMETARRAGMTPVGCLWGFRDRHELTSAGAATIVSHPREIEDLLRGS
jgi:phosphoglycolate phosphatase